MSGDAMVVKVQMPQAGVMAFALVYNEDRLLSQQFPITEKLRSRMNGRKKVFFNVTSGDIAGLVGPAELILDEEVEDPGW